MNLRSKPTNDKMLIVEIRIYIHRVFLFIVSDFIMITEMCGENMKYA